MPVCVKEMLFQLFLLPPGHVVSSERSVDQMRSPDSRTRHIHIRNQNDQQDSETEQLHLFYSGFVCKALDLSPLFGDLASTTFHDSAPRLDVRSDVQLKDGRVHGPGNPLWFRSFLN